MSASSPAPTSGRRPLAALLVAALLALLAACSSLPARPPLPVESRLAPAETGPLAERIAPMVAARAPASGFLPLESGLDAFAARVWLVDRASRSLDVQCYIWRGDRTGRWLLSRLVAAAERGVRVRLLLDDNNGSEALDALLATLDADRRIEVRMFNPYPHRGFGRAWDLATDFSRLHRRMHNKSFTADGLATIFGGRNAGDEYFGVDDDVQFADLDVLTVGPIVAEVADSFDRYWNSPLAYPLASLRSIPATPPALSETERAAAQVAEDYARSLREKPMVERWRERGPQSADFAWGRSTLLVDPPEKVERRAAREDLMVPRLARTLREAERSIDLVSPYFVPTDDGVAAFAELRKKGVRIRVLTNSLAATDVAAAHSGYSRYRDALLDAGIELYELRADPQPVPRRGHLIGTGSSSEASLHAKTFAVDGERVFIGSFNFDPRSAWLNSEIGALLEHPGLARRVGITFDQDVPKQAWRVSREAGSLRWTTETPQGPQTVDAEPDAGWLRRLATKLLSLLPIDWLL